MKTRGEKAVGLIWMGNDGVLTVAVEMAWADLRSRPRPLDSSPQALSLMP